MRLAFFSLLFFSLHVVHSLSLRSFTRRTGTVVILQESQTDGTCVQAGVRQVKEEEKKTESSIFDNSDIVHIKGDGIIHMTSYSF